MEQDATTVFKLQTPGDHSKTFTIPVVQELAKSVYGDDTLPQRYVRHVASSSSDHVAGMLPIIDMGVILCHEKSDARRQEMQKLSAACEEWGFFQVVNHGVPVVLMDKMKKICREFFGLPLEERMKYKMGKDRQGYGQTFIQSDDQTLDWCDILVFNVFPQQLRKTGAWPQMPPDFGDTLIEYATEAKKLALALMSLSEESLGLETGTFTDLSKDPGIRVRMNYYPPCPRPDQALGLSPHSDGDYLTLLLQDGQTPGLQIRKNDEWFTVQPLDNALVVNIGDYMEVMTNGRYKSIEHRAITNRSNPRISIASFCSPNRHQRIKPAPALVDNMPPSIYKEISVADYLQARVSKSLQGKNALIGYMASNQ